MADSDPESEYRECGWKARFLTELPPEFGLFETMRAEAGRIPLLDDHLGRLKTAAAALNLSLPDDAGTYQPGDLVEFPAPDGSRFAGVLKEQDETGALFDFNHPLAGKAVRFEVKLLGVL